MELGFDSGLVQPQNLCSFTALSASQPLEAVGSDPGLGGLSSVLVDIPQHQIIREALEIRATVWSSLDESGHRLH